MRRQAHSYLSPRPSLTAKPISETSRFTLAAIVAAPFFIPPLPHTLNLPPLSLPAPRPFNRVASSPPGATGRRTGASRASEAVSAMSSHHPPGPGPRPSPDYSTTLPSIASPPIKTPPTTGTHGPLPAMATTDQYSNFQPSPPIQHHRHHQAGEPFRANVAASNAVPLPSMRTMDSIAQQASQNLGRLSSVPPPPPPPPLLPGTGGGVPPLYATGHRSAMPSSPYTTSPENRFSLPSDPAFLARTPKREIKRRTKTGCLTCRKRRIKCDETHPICNNCRKSRRECLGYDPIFRTHPLLVNTLHHGSTASSAEASSPLPKISPSYPPPKTSPSYPPPGSDSSSLPPEPLSASLKHPYPSPLPSTYNPSPRGPAYATPASSAARQHSPAHSERFEPLPPILPRYPESEPGSDPLGLGQKRQDFSKALPSPTIYDWSSHLRGSKMKIDDIINLLGPPPPGRSLMHTAAQLTEVTKVYHEMYAGGLSAFFETNWYYFSDNGKISFPIDSRLVEHMVGFLSILEGVKTIDHAQMAYSGALETRIVWELAKMAGEIDAPMPSSRGGLPPDGDPAEARSRFRVVDALLSGEYLPTNPLCPPFQDHDPHRARQHDFWFHLGEFVKQRDNPRSPAALKAKEDSLNRLRHLLDGRENRDLLYSIAVVRDLAPNFAPGYGNSVPQHLDESDPKNRLAVASRFIVDESQVTGGTTNVVRRFGDIATRAFVNPGVNIARPS